MVSKWHPASFGGDFDLLPLRSDLLFSAVPLHPTSDDFQLAAMGPVDTEAAARWRVEAIRHRRANPGAALDDAALRLIAARCASEFFRAAQAE